MRRSASTLQYLLAKELVELAGGHAAGWVIHQKFDKCYYEYNGRFPLVVLKTHAFTPNFSSIAKSLFESNSAFALTIFRDPRDVATSLLGRNKFTMTWEAVMQDMPVVLAEFTAWSSTYPDRTLLQAYGADPLRLLGELSSFLKIPVDSEWSEDCANRHSLEAHKKLIEEYDGKFDRVSLLHHNHIDEGKIGRYKDELSLERRHEIEEFYKAWKATQ